jgi:hypothetical protein
LLVGVPQARKLVWLISHSDGDLQQPVQPLLASQTQVAALPLPEQRVPAGQAAPVAPHTQLPLAHWLATVASQLTQLPGVVPQALVPMLVWHVPAASQQPLGHEVASHTQAPLTQRLPLPQVTPPGPHEQLPLPRQVSVAPVQAAQAAPLVPHAAALGAVQLLPMQQPLAHVIVHPEQLPFTH